MRSAGLRPAVNNPTQLWKTHVALGGLYRETRRPDPSRASFAAARAVIDSIGESLRTPELKEGFEGSQVFCKVFEQIGDDRAQDHSARPVCPTIRR